MNPNIIKQKVEDSLSKQLRFMYPIDRICPNTSIAEEIKRLFPVGEEDKSKRHEFVNSAYVESIPQYKPGRTLKELVDKDILHESTATALARYFKCSTDIARLHEHQENSLLSVRDGENLLVCTGTGSGKTESFLIPVLDAIVRERVKKADDYVPGVRAMILYPMNALVNDQVLRIRNILREAQDLEGMKDITYGIYTGDVATESSELALLELDEAAKNAVNNVNSLEVDHPYFSDDIVPSTEYTRRSRWNSTDDGGDGPADILITNYAMLERLMLNPKNSNLFSNTWKFIILDEAHTYDGSMGTEIAWLLKRLSYRVGGAQNLQYLATSATLIESKSNQDNNPIKDNHDGCNPIKDEIRKLFAERIFPNNEKNFTIELGNPQESTGKQGPEGEYSKILEYSGIELENEICNLHERLQIHKPATLFEQYLWLKEVEQKLERYSYLAKIENREDWALGDFVRVASIVSELNENESFRFFCDDIATLLGKLPDNKTIIERAIQENCSDFGNAVQDWIDGYNKEFNLKAHSVYSFSMCIVSVFDSYDMSEIDTFTPAALPIQINEDTQQLLIQYVENYKKWVESLKKIKTKISDKWREYFHNEDNSSIETLFTEYICSHGELLKLLQYMQGKTHVEYHELAEATMGQNVNQFDCFCQLLALTKSKISRNKPLVDLRFHQTAQGLHNMMIRFSSSDGRVSVNLLPNASGVQINDERIYNMGCCQHCGQPYILAYSDMQAPADITNLTNYKDGSYKYLFALAWEVANQVDDVAEQDEQSNDYWLEYKKGKLHRAEQRPGSVDDFIKIHYVATAGDTEQNKQHINKCPSCNDLMTKGGDYTLIAPYKLSDDHARCFILRALAANSDRDPVAVGKPAEGRKVLAFSDSRSMAARVPMTFDEISEYKLLDYIVYESVRKYAQGQSVSLSPNPQNGDISIVDNVIKLLKDRHATSLLKREYELNNVLREFPEKDVASQLILETIRSSSTRSLIGRKYINIESYAFSQRAGVREWDRFVRECNNDNFFAEKLFLSVYNYLVRKGQLTCQHLQPNGGRGNYFSLDYTNAEGEDYSYGKKIMQHARQNGNDFIFFRGNNNISPRLRKWICKHDPNHTINDTTSVVDRLLRYMQTHAILIPEGNNNRFVLNAADIRLKIGDENPQNLMFDDDFFFRIEEHSGQISKNLAFVHQRYFSSGEINILSCSTTFEMGVDLGNLNTVFLCNLPPAVANYRQRAGRAGRRAGSSAYVLTFIGSESAHDSYFGNDPASFLFQKVTPPVIYTDIRSYSAKHMRAEALSSFLKYCGPNCSWKRCSSFFCRPTDLQNLRLIDRLENWYNECYEEVAKRCNEIAGYELTYNPAADLCFQLVGSHVDALNGLSLIELAGPCLAQGVNNEWNYWKAPALYRYQKKCQTLQADAADIGNRACLRMGREDLASYLASMRVLPRYGFPCDTVQLNVSGSDVKLQRDRAIALREYLPGATVAANKKYYLSTNPKSLGNQYQHPINAQPISIYQCLECQEIFSGYDIQQVKCPKCGQNVDRQLRLTVPDFFSGRRVTKKTFPTQKIIECYGGGQQDAQLVQGTNLDVATSDTREILYVNTAWRNKDFDGLMHILRTDIVLWKMHIKPNNNNKVGVYNAWMSALQAVLKAASEVLQVHSKDISGMISREPNDNYLMVIYDSSTSGAGSVLKLMPGNREEDIEIKILKRALEICIDGSCKCGNMEPNEGNKTVVSDGEWYNQPNQQHNIRVAKACYNCIMSYTNRHVHSKLDAYDASVILKAMLGDALKVLAAPEYERVSEEEIMDIRAGKYDDSKSYRVLVNGEYKELMLKRGKTKSARFHLDDAFVEVAYDCVFKM